jgi:hypothetical protein
MKQGISRPDLGLRALPPHTLNLVDIAKAISILPYYPQLYDSRSGGVLGTLIYPHLILSYSEYYGHLAVPYGVFDAPLWPSGAMIRKLKYMQRLFT